MRGDLKYSMALNVGGRKDDAVVLGSVLPDRRNNRYQSRQGEKVRHSGRTGADFVSARCITVFGKERAGITLMFPGVNEGSLNAERPRPRARPAPGNATTEGAG